MYAALLLFGMSLEICESPRPCSKPQHANSANSLEMNRASQSQSPPGPSYEAFKRIARFSPAIGDFW